MDTYKVAPMYRRAAWYLVGGALLTFPAMWYQHSFEEFVQNEVGGWFVCIMLLVAANLFVVWVERIRFRLEDGGISRRFYFRWDPWPWDVFASGHVQYTAEMLLFTDPRRPWWRRKLSLALLGEAERERLLDACLRHWNASAVEPKEALALSVRRRLLWRTRVSLAADGISVTEGGQTSFHSWCEVQSVWVFRHRQGQPDFRSLCLVLAGREIVLTKIFNQGNPRMNWRGSDGAAVFTFLSRHLPKEKVHVGHWRGEATGHGDLILRVVLYRRLVSKSLRAASAVLALISVCVSYYVYKGVSTHTPWWAFCMLALIFGSWLSIPLLTLHQIRAALCRAEREATETLGTARLSVDLDEAHFRTRIT